MSTLHQKALLPLFYSPLAVFEIADAEQLNHLLLAEIETFRTHSGTRELNAMGGWHSSLDFFERSEPGCQALRNHIVAAIQASTLGIAPDFDFASSEIQGEGWINVLGRGGLHTPHDHPTWVWSGYYYVSVPESDQEFSGAIEFFDHRTNVRTLTVDGAACFASQFVMKPKAGTLLMFPSYLRHWVYPNDSDQERVSVAFNVRFARKIE